MNASTKTPTASQAAEPAWPATKFKKLLVPVDFSPASRAALRYAAAQAAESHGSVTLIAVIPNDQTVFEYGEIEAITSRERRREQWMRDLRKLAGETLCNTAHREIIEVGRPFEEIVFAAKKLGADLIVISRHNQDRDTRTELGSTTERVVRYAGCPVLVVIPPPEVATPSSSAGVD